MVQNSIQWILSEEKCFEIMKKIIVNKTNHNSQKLSNLKKFQEAIAYPISKNDFLENMNNLMGDM